jgi:hypothetical protein
MADVVDYLHRHGAPYRANTVRTEITSRLCANAPANHAVRYADFLRLGGGRYFIL